LANTASSQKRARQNRVRRARNRTQRSALRTQVKKMRQAIDEKEAQLPQLFVETQSALDRAAGNGQMHRNKAARLKARLAAAMKRNAG
jgi:small subunit ribosomal protein S20